MAALRSFQEMLYMRDKLSGEDKDLASASDVNLREIWDVAWKVWLRIATESLSRSNNDSEADYPSQQFLATLIQIFPSVFQHIHTRLILEKPRFTRLRKRPRGIISIII